MLFKVNEKVKVCNVMKTLYTLHFLHIVDIKKKWKCCTHLILLKSTICCNSFIKWILKKVKVLYTFILWKSTIFCILIICWLFIIWDYYNFQDISAHPPVWTLTGRQALWGPTIISYHDEKSSYVGKSSCDWKSQLIFNRIIMMIFHHMMWSHNWWWKIIIW